MLPAKLTSKENNTHIKQVEGNFYFWMSFYLLPGFLHIGRPVDVVQNQNCARAAVIHDLFKIVHSSGVGMIAVNKHPIQRFFKP